MPSARLNERVKSRAVVLIASLPMVMKIPAERRVSDPRRARLRFCGILTVAQPSNPELLASRREWQN
jgi:hypothetical protein